MALITITPLVTLTVPRDVRAALERIALALEALVKKDQAPILVGEIVVGETQEQPDVPTPVTASP